MIKKWRRKSLLKRIESNVASLFKDALLLETSKSFGSASALMIAAREESVKYILVYCWNHLDDKIKKKIYQHDFKYEAGLVFYYLSGRIQMSQYAIAGLQLLKDNPAENDLKSIEIVSKHIHSMADFDDPVELASSIQHVLFGEYKKGHEERDKEARRRAEQTRQNSFYVDFDRDLNVTGSPKLVTQKKYAELKRQVELAQFYINGLSGRPASRERLLEIFPEWEKEQRTGIAGLKKKLEADRKRRGIV